RMQGLEFPLTF
nr:immunoglobulin light chain junction region [Macaca mulatta]